MKRLTYLCVIALSLIGLQGCATSNADNTSNMEQGSTMPSSDYLNRQDVPKSPAGRISGGSGAMHQGMSGTPH